MPKRFSKFFAAASFIMQTAVLGLAAAFVLTKLWPQYFERQGNDNRGRDRAIMTSFSETVRKAAPAVVNISSQKKITEPAYRVFVDPFRQRSYGVPWGQRQRFERTLGSGVIVRPDGYLLTNFHVIAGAEDIYIGLYDGRVTKASIVGVDQDTDLAVLKIEGANFPAAAFPANEGQLTVGDVVLAIGNPSGIGQTVTMGIVSATGRDQPSLSRFEDFIQTDAAINSGNSGGALINAHGELVGINTAQASSNEAFIGFAIPAQAAREVLEQIIDRGYVVRGWMGAEYASVPYSGAVESVGSSELGRSVKILAILPGGPADRAGLQVGDLLTRFNGIAIQDDGDLRDREAQAPPKAQVRIEGLRATVPFSVELALIERPRIQLPERPRGR